MYIFPYDIFAYNTYNSHDIFGYNAWTKSPESPTSTGLHAITSVYIYVYIFPYDVFGYNTYNTHDILGHNA